MDLHKKINKSFLKVPLLILSFCICFTFFNLNVFAEGLGNGGKPATEVSNSNTKKEDPNATVGKEEHGSWGGGGNNSYKAWYEVSKNANGGDMVEFVAEDKYGNVYRGNDAVNRTKNYNIDTSSFYESMMKLNNMTADQTNAWLAENGFSVDANGRIKDKDGNTLSWVDLAAKDAKDWDEEITDEDGNVIDKIKHHICGSVEVSLGTRWNLVSVNGFGGGRYYDDNPEYTYARAQQVDEGYSAGQSFPSDAQSVYEGAGNSWEDHQSKPEWIEMATTYIAQWLQAEKYQYVCPGCGKVVAGPYYRIISASSDSFSLSWNADIVHPEWTYLAPIDLTTEERYTNPIPGFPAAGPDTVDLKITEKSDFKKGERLVFLDTLKPASFQIDFGDTWFGIKEGVNNIHLTGKDRYDEELGGHEQFIDWIELRYSGKYNNNTDNPKIVTMNHYLKDQEDECTDDMTELIDELGDADKYKGNHKFYLRSVKASKDIPYKLGYNQLEAWYVSMVICRNNYKGVDWSAYCGPNPGSLNGGIDKENYTKFVTWNNFDCQPILHGEYDVRTVAGMAE